MKTKMSKVLALAASAVLLVCMLAVGVTPASADATPVGTASDPLTAYDKTVTINASTAGVTIPEGNTLLNGKPGSWIDPYYGLVILNPEGSETPYTVPVGGFITVALDDAFEEILFEVLENNSADHGPNGTGYEWAKVEVSADGTTWAPLNFKRIKGEDKYGATSHNLRETTLSATVPADAGYKFVRLSYDVACEWGFITPAIKAIKYNVAEVAAPAPEAVGTATDKKDAYDVTKSISKVVTFTSEGTVLTSGWTGAGLGDYCGLQVKGENASATGNLVLFVGEVFTDLYLVAAENTNGKGGAGYRWDKIEVSANGTDWFPLNFKRVDTETTVANVNFSLKEVAITATVDAAAKYQYVRLTATDVTTWGFIERSIKAIQYNRVTEPVGTAGAAKDEYAKEKDFSTATLPNGTSLTDSIPGVNGTSAGDGYLCLTTPDAGLCVNGSIVLNIGEVFTDISVLGMQNNASEGFVGFYVSADGENWAPLNIQKNDTGSKHAIGGWDISYFTYNSTVDAAAGYKFLRIDVVGCPWAMPSPAVKAVKYNTPAPPWTPTLSDNATVVDGNIIDGMGLASAPYSYGFCGNGNPNQNGSPVDHEEKNVGWLGSRYSWYVHNTYHNSEARFAFEVNSPKDFKFTVRIDSAKADVVADGISVYSCEGFEGGSYAGAPANTTEPATPINAKKIKVRFVEAATQPGHSGLKVFDVFCDEDLDVAATYLYLVYDGSLAKADEDYASSLIDFDYTSDPITIVDLPAFNEADEDAGEAEMMEDMVSSLLTLADNGQAFSLTNLMRAAGVKFGTFNPADDVLKLRDNTADGEIVYDLSAYNDYWNETEGFKANVNSVDVRGWISGEALNGTAPLMSVMVSKDGETWTALEGDQDTVRANQRHNGYYEYSLLFDEIDEGYSWVKVVLKASDAEIGVSDIQILYNEAADDGDDDNNPDTGVVAPVAALVLATISGAAVVINKKRR
ncbi:MAG: hypothetical protein IJW89_06130 [Clostridia bacterium]|nr:hypothetical protein [Clostridia bacterium]